MFDNGDGVNLNYDMNDELYSYWNNENFKDQVRLWHSLSQL